MTIGVTCAHPNTHIENAIDPTCVQEGYTGDVVCDDCGFVTAGNIIVTADHNFVYFSEGEDGTCTKAAYYYEKCTDCTAIRQVETVFGEHEYVYDPGCEASCMKDGMTASEYCGRCGEVFVEGVVIPAPGHCVEVILGYEATCYQDGLTDGAYCDICGEILIEQEVIPGGHVESEWTACEYDIFGRVSMEEIICTRCGEQLDLRIPASEHNAEVIVEGYDATCDENGLTAGLFCEECNEWIFVQETIPALGHKEGDWETVYDKDGNVKYEEKLCENCGMQLDMRIPADPDNNGGGIDIYDNILNIGAIDVGCTGTIGMVGMLPCVALLSGLMIRRKKNSNTEEVEE